MKPFNGWLFCSLMVLTAAIFGFLTAEPDFAWNAFDYPIPVKRGNFDEIYLSDFSYLSFLALTVYWVVSGRFAKNAPTTWNASGILLALAAACFATVSLDFLFAILPQSSECVESTMGNGLLVKSCTYGHDYRIWVAVLAAILLVASLLASVMGGTGHSDDG